MKETESSRQKIICIVGPTACHKTELSIELAKRTSGEIVSADSVQVYFDMDIGSAKPSIEERQGIPHHMIDCVPIETVDFSVAMFRSMAMDSINDILAGKNAGVDTIGLSYGYNYGVDIRDSKPNFAFDNFAELLKLLGV